MDDDDLRLTPESLSDMAMRVGKLRSMFLCNVTEDADDDANAGHLFLLALSAMDSAAQFLLLAANHAKQKDGK